MPKVLTPAQILKKEQWMATCNKWEALFELHRKAFNLPEPERQFLFHPTRKWRADFCWPSKKIIVEIEGGIWRGFGKKESGGAHSHPSNIERDIDKYNAATALGYRIYRFTEKQLETLEAVKIIVHEFEEKLV